MLDVAKQTDFAVHVGGAGLADPATQRPASRARGDRKILHGDRATVRGQPTRRTDHEPQQAHSNPQQEMPPKVPTMQ